MLQHTTWEAVRELQLIGRDLVNNDPHLGTARGPISGIRVTDDGWVIITQQWTAKPVGALGPTPGVRWRFWQSPDHVSVVPQYSPPTIRDDGRIEFSIPVCGTLTILPEGDRLDPAAVEGLPASLATP
ncbi:MAG: hypothetical protein Q7R80_04875 [bacterium]|nr:hypothetical protein [bacterium]